MPEIAGSTGQSLPIRQITPVKSPQSRHLSIDFATDSAMASRLPSLG
jgi:hypothetical protein